MGDLLFNVLKPDQYDPRIWDSAYITGIEGIPWRCHQSIAGDQFSIGREIEESGKVSMIWPSSTLGKICLTTTSLRISPNCYTLGLELARGTVFRLRTQASDWQRIGLRLPDSYFPIAEESLSQLLRALTTQDDDEAQLTYSNAAIDLALKASVELCEAYSNQALDSRRQSEGRLATLMGAELVATPMLSKVGKQLNSAFNLTCIPADMGSVESSSGSQDFTAFDQQIKWAQSHGKKVAVGPLVDFSRGSLPQWMVLLDEGFESIKEAACQHAQNTVQRYSGQVHLWNCAAGLNAPNDMGWTDEEILRIAVSLIETVRRTDQRCPVLLTIDQPWSEYLRKDANGISPLHFADALIRADLGLSGLALDLRFGASEGESFPRDLIEINRLIDRWAMLGLPLMVLLSSSCQLGTTDNVESESGDELSQWKSPQESNGSVSPESIIRLLLSKPSIHAIIWSELQDSERGKGGIWNRQGQPKPILESITSLRKRFLH